MVDLEDSVEGKEAWQPMPLRNRFRKRIKRVFLARMGMVVVGSLSMALQRAAEPAPKVLERSMALNVVLDMMGRLRINLPIQGWRLNPWSLIRSHDR
mmetsp:Transcript_26512/g.48780  ORF Transcript_26512/g.48780 Transcript_26512/m.48780 type:complete len:97 (+) Transcript_26512:1334-1624(+)